MGAEPRIRIVEGRTSHPTRRIGSFQRRDSWIRLREEDQPDRPRLQGTTRARRLQRRALICSPPASTPPSIVCSGQPSPSPKPRTHPG